MKVTPDITATTFGYAYSEATRRASNAATSCSPPRVRSPHAVALFRPDFLLQPDVIDFYDIALIDTDESIRFRCPALTNATYAQVQAFITPKSV